jgi:anti-sigma regulatory factor (Ser/Thr protein kinase)
VKNFTFTPEILSLERFQQVILKNVSDNFNKKKVCLACEEAFTNIVNYAKATAIEVGIDESTQNLVVVFKDDGEPFNPLEEDVTEKLFDDCENGGMGIGIIKNIADACYLYSNNHNVLLLTFPSIKTIKRQSD